jgi:Secretion system C-terminal sorting domain
MRRPLFIVLLLLFLASVSSAQSDPGVFAMIGFFDQELVYINQATGQTSELGLLSTTASTLRIHHDRLYVVNGDDWFTGEGASLWVANLDQLNDVAHNGGEVNWTIVPIENGTNPYDLAGFDHYVYVTLQQGNGVIKLDIDADYEQVESVSGINMPQGIAVSGAVVCVTESGLGFGEHVYFMDTDLNSPYPIQVGRNPQTVVVGLDGHFHVICTGNYADITAEAWQIDPNMGEPGTSSIELGGTPGILVSMTDGNGNEKIVCGDEYAANPPYLYAYDPGEMSLDETVPVNRSGGWSLAAGNDGIFIGSAIANTVQFNAYDWSGYQLVHSFDGAVASLVYYEMLNTSVASDHNLTPSSFTLSSVWPNPFNASASLELTLEHPRHATITLFNALGRQVRLLQKGQLPAGSHLVHLDAQNLASGTYFVTARASDFAVSQRLTVVR